MKTLLTEHKRWLLSSEKSGARARLSTHDLSDVDLQDCDLRRADLRNANLRRAKLHRAKLDDALLDDADLTEAELPEASLRRAMLNGAILKRADLWRARLEGASCWRASFAGAKLMGASFDAPEGSTGKVASLQQADLRKAHLRDARLGTVDGLAAHQLAGTDLTHASLPADVARFDGLAHVTQISQNAQTTFFALLAACSFSWLTIATTRDSDLLGGTTTLNLPLLGTGVSPSGFYIAAPLLLAAVYVYLLLYLQRLWIGLAALPAVFPDGKPLDGKAYPWLLNGVVRRLFQRLGTAQGTEPGETAEVRRLLEAERARERERRRTLYREEYYVAILLAWCLVPFTLLLLWARYLPRHDWPSSFVQLVVIVSAAWFGERSFRIAMAVFGETEAADADVGSLAVSPRLPGYAPGPRTVTVGLSALILTVVAVALPTGRQDRAEARRACSPEAPPWLGTLAFGLSLYPFYDTAARLDDAVLSARPAGWNREVYKSDDLANVTGARLEGVDLRHATLRRTFLARARLRNADLRGADLTEAELQGADLSGAKLTCAILKGADLRDARLVGASVGPRQLEEARTDGACAGSDDIGALALPACP